MTERKLGILKSFTSLDADISLPSVEQFDVQTMDSPDIFITALGFEERVLKIPELIANAWVNHNVKSVVAILGEYTTNVNDNETIAKYKKST